MWHMHTNLNTVLWTLTSTGRSPAEISRVDGPGYIPDDPGHCGMPVARGCRSMPGTGVVTGNSEDGDRDGPGPPGNCQRLARGAPPSPGLARPVAATHLTVALDVRQLELEAAKPPFHWQSQAQPELTQVIPNPTGLYY